MAFPESFWSRSLIRNAGGGSGVLERKLGSMEGRRARDARLAGGDFHPALILRGSAGIPSSVIETDGSSRQAWGSVSTQGQGPQNSH